MPFKPRSLRTDRPPLLHLLDWGGGGTPLLLLHGMAGNVHWWDRAAPALQGAFRPVALDFRGHGDSDWLKDGGYEPRGFEEDVEAARLFLGWDRFLLAGHSLGARVALEYAHRRPAALAGLAAVDFLSEFYEAHARRFTNLRTRHQPVYHSETALLERFHFEPPGTLLDARALREFAKLCVKRTEGGWTWKFDWRAFLYRYDPVWPTLPGIRVPTLVVRGERSTVMRRGDFERVVGSIPGARGVELAKAHHHVPLDTPAELTAEMISFAESLP